MEAEEVMGVYVSWTGVVLYIMRFIYTFDCLIKSCIRESIDFMFKLTNYYNSCYRI
jgi:hypothetical protein